MAANPLKIGITLTAGGRFKWCRPMLDPPKDVFSVRLRPSGPVDYMLSEKILDNVSVDMFAGKTAVSNINPQLSLLASVFSSPWLSCLVQAVI
jgi:hypothetical protein